MADEDEELKEQRAAELRAHQEIKNILKHRLLLYQKQRAILGDRTPPDVDIGIAATEQEIRLVEAKMRALRIDPKVLEAVGPEGLFLEISAKIDNLVETTQVQNERLDTIEGRVAEGAAWRETETRARTEGQQKKARRDRLILTTLLAILVIVLISGGILLYVNR